MVAKIPDPTPRQIKSRAKAIRDGWEDWREQQRIADPRLRAIPVGVSGSMLLPRGLGDEVLVTEEIELWED